MAHRTLTRLELNRTFLSRQLLLSRSSSSVEAATKQLLGLQAQVQQPPFIGLWSRLHGFQPEDLTNALIARTIVRAPLMRSTLHLFSAADYQQLRMTIQPALTRGLNSFHGKNIKGLDFDPLLEAARQFLKERTRAIGEVRSYLATQAPEIVPEALAYGFRTFIPVVQVPSDKARWGYGNAPEYVLAAAWLGQAVNPHDDLETLIMRYVAACGPASVMDMQTWAGMPKLKDAFDKVRPKLHSYRDDQGRELFDLPDGVILPAEVPAPVRFIPEYDNSMISHQNRTRILAEAYRTKVFLSAARVRATVLLNGFVCAAWKIEKAKSTVTLIIDLFETVSATDREAIAEEGERLLRFVEPGVTKTAISFVAP